MPCVQPAETSYPLTASFGLTGTPLWSNVMKLLTEPDMVDTELLVYAMTLINKTLNGIPDQDTYYDQVDAIEEQGIERVIQKYVTLVGSCLLSVRAHVVSSFPFSDTWPSPARSLIFSDNFRSTKSFCNTKTAITNLLRSEWTIQSGKHRICLLYFQPPLFRTVNSRM